MSNFNYQMIPNHTGSAIGFKLDSLLKLTDTRASNSKMTLMHYLCKVWFLKFCCLLCVSISFFVAYPKSAYSDFRVATWFRLGWFKGADLIDFVGHQSRTVPRTNELSWVSLKCIFIVLWGWCLSLHNFFFFLFFWGGGLEFSFLQLNF